MSGLRASGSGLKKWRPTLRRGLLAWVRRAMEALDVYPRDDAPLRRPQEREHAVSPSARPRAIWEGVGTKNEKGSGSAEMR
jgi:hypothetical protein